MRARGIDSGEPVWWCDIEREGAGVFHFIAKGSWDASAIGRGSLLSMLGDVDVYAIETPKEMHPNEVRAQAAHPATMVQTIRNLLETRAMAERIAGALAVAGARIVEPTAAEVRHALGVKFGAQRGRGPKLTVDQQIGHIIPLAVRGWPKRSNPGERDAAAAALWALGGADVETAVRLALAGARS